MLPTMFAWSLPNGHAGKQMLFLMTIAPQPIANDFSPNASRVLRAPGKVGSVTSGRVLLGPFACKFGGAPTSSSTFMRRYSSRY